MFLGWRSAFTGLRTTRLFPGVATRWLWRRALRGYGARWAVSAAARDALAKTLRVRRESFTVLRNGVDVVRYCPATFPTENRRRLGLPTDRVVLLAVGNVTAVKNHRLALEGIRAAHLPPERYTLVIIGEDRLGGQTQRWAAAKLPGHDVRFPRPRQDLLDWYHAADVFVLPSRSEGLCNALLEAMACGLAVVASDVAANQEVLRDGETGLLASLGDPVAFGRALRRLVADGKLRRRMGHAAREHVTAEYDINRMVEAVARVYERLCVRR